MKREELFDFLEKFRLKHHAFRKRECNRKYEWNCGNCSFMFKLIDELKEEFKK